MPEIRRLDAKMRGLITDVCPFYKEPIKATWIKPSIKVEVHYLEMTEDGKLRFPSYKGEK